MPELKPQLHFQVYLSANAHLGKQEVMAQGGLAPCQARGQAGLSCMLLNLGAGALE